MASKMLIDSSHQEETRVVVTRGNKIEEFDFESASRRQLRGNIYLAKVTRVEPSLQAAFIEYGGNRHGFLAFSEIHPDYYQIPVADRQALVEADERAERDAEHEEEERPRRGGRRRRGSERRRRGPGETVSSAAEDAPLGTEDDGPSGEAPEGSEHLPGDEEDAGHHPDEPEPDAPHAGTDDHPGEDDRTSSGEMAPEPAATDAEPHPAETHPAEPSAPSHEAAGLSAELETVLASVDEVVHPLEDEHPHEQEHAHEDEHPEDDEHAEEDEHEDHDDDEEDDEEEEEHEVVEQVGGSDALEEVRERRRSYRRQYKIQEVIKRRQVLLIQVVKEERGNKGAALTTYLSLAGRYAVLMPNTGKGGGISRKITSAEDRKRLKEIVQDLEVPDGMGIILRTAGASRTKPEIKRDFEYLMRLWESVRELTLKSSAPTLVYEEGSLIKRAIRDLYHKEIEEVVVAGEEGYREAKDFMGMIMPAQAKAVRPYREPQALFASFGIEAQLDAMFSNHVTLKSGGYLVINPTEALVSIDVNSGRSTREHNIEDTALRTNVEAAEEIARQLRLRDLAGLIVIDFIDMEERRNNRTVEKKLKDCLKNDRARIQVGRISPFGLLEMSRQRIRTGVLESSSIPCAVCAGTGFVRSTPSVALQILRSIEESLLRSASHDVVVRTRTVVAFYILNQKRPHLAEIEARFGVAVAVSADESLPAGTTFAIDRGALASPMARPVVGTGIRIDSITHVDEPIEIEPTEEFERAEEERDERRNREPRGEARRARGDDRQGLGEERQARGEERQARGEERQEQGEGSEERGEEREPQAEASDEAGEDGGRRRRRRRRRGRGPRRDAAEGELGLSGEEEDEDQEERGLNGTEVLADGGEPGDAGAPVIEAPRRRSSRPERRDAAEESFAETAPAAQPVVILREPDAEPADAMAEAPTPVVQEPEIEPEEEPVAVVLTPVDPDRPKRGGWWSRAKSALGG